MLNQLLLPNVVDAVNKGVDRGNALAFNKLAGQYVSDPTNNQSLLGQLAGLNPQNAMALQNNVESQQAAQQKMQLDQQQAQLKKIGGAAKFMYQAYQTGDPAKKQGAYQALYPFMSSLAEEHGQPAPPTQWDDSMLPTLYQVLGMTGGLPENKGVVVSNGGSLVDPMTGKQLFQSTPKEPDQIRSLRILSGNPDLLDTEKQLKEAGRNVTSVNMGPQENSFQKAVGQKDAGQYVQWRSDAANAATTLQQADELEDVLNAQQTGKVQEALAKAGQYFGTQAGANLQSLKGIIQPLVLSQVKQLGSGFGISDADRAFVESGMPGFGNDPRANTRVLKVMRQMAQRKIDLYRQAQQYVGQHHSLDGFTTPLITPPASPTSNSGTPSAAVQYLRQNPGTAAQFDAKYGQGASAQYLGGQ